MPRRARRTIAHRVAMEHFSSRGLARITLAADGDSDDDSDGDRNHLSTDNVRFSPVRTLLRRAALVDVLLGSFERGRKLQTCALRR
jgi:hypothetical protein